MRLPLPQRQGVQKGASRFLILVHLHLLLQGTINLSCARYRMLMGCELVPRQAELLCSRTSATESAS